MVIVESRTKSFRTPWSEWSIHHEQPNRADAEESIAYLKASDESDRKSGLIAWHERTEYRIKPE